MRFTWLRIAAAIAMVVALQPVIGEAAAYQPEYVREEAYSQGVADERTIPFEALLPDRTGDFILPWETLAWQVGEGLGVAPLRVRHLPNGRRLLWGCRRHSCMEKGAVVLSPTGEVEAAALLHYRCHFTAFPVRQSRSWRKSNYTCDDGRRLTVFVHVTQTHRPHFEHWAEAVTGEKAPVEIYWV